MKKLQFILCLVFLALFFSYIAFVNLNRPRIYIVYSFDANFKWEKDINEGLESVLKKHVNYLTRTIYLRTDFRYNKENESRMAQRAIKLIKQWKPDILLLVDDKAQSLVGSQFVNDPSIKIVFAAVAAPLKDYHYDKANNISGVCQNLPLEEFEQMVDKITPAREKTFTYLYDNEFSSKVFHNQVRKYPWKSVNIVDYVECTTLDEWAEAVKKAEKTSNYILVSVYSSIKRSADSDEVLSSNEINQWMLKNSKIPLFSLVVEGDSITFGNSPLEQGSSAGYIIEKLLDYHIPIKDIPIKTSKWFTISIHEKECKRYDVNIPEVYYNFAHVTDTLL